MNCCCNLGRLTKGVFSSPEIISRHTFLLQLFLHTLDIHRKTPTIFLARNSKQYTNIQTVLPKYMSSSEQKAAKQRGQENTDTFISEYGRCNWCWLHNIGLTLLFLYPRIRSAHHQKNCYWNFFKRKCHDQGRGPSRQSQFRWFFFFSRRV